MQNLLKRHYQTIVNRGLITKETKIKDFLTKIAEEYQELLEAEDGDNFKQEAIDVVMVVLNMLQHKGVDIKKELIKNIEIQERRVKDGKSDF